MNFAHLSPILEWDLAPCTQGCQDITGPIPPSFLISLMQIKGISFYHANFADLFFRIFEAGLKLTENKSAMIKKGIENVRCRQTNYRQTEKRKIFDSEKRGPHCCIFS